jgi:hypothetical protein
MRWMGHIAHIGEMGIVYIILVAKPERKRQLGCRRRRLEDNIRTDLRELGWEVVDSMTLP